MTELGAALRRAGRRGTAGELPGGALHMSARYGAHRLSTRAGDELKATGARRRRIWRTGLEASTPTELRIVRLAADGRSNREIALELCVTLKTVEAHLWRAYTNSVPTAAISYRPSSEGEKIRVLTTMRTNRRRPDHSFMETHGIVIGSGVGGLLTARVLAGHLDRVTIIDRDEFPTGCEPRKGIPQGRHAHGLLAAGERVIRDLFPGLIEELVVGGAQRTTTADARWWQFGGYRVGGPGPGGTFFSRPYLESGIRQRVRCLPNVDFVQAAVAGLAMTADRVTGVITSSDDLDLDAASLVVDASGRASGTPRWLAAYGYPQPPVSEININMGYASRLYRRTPGLFPDGTWIITIDDPAKSKRLGVAFPIEGDRWIVTLAGMHGDHAPTDEAGFAEFAESLSNHDVAAVVRSEEPLTPIVTHRLASDRWRHYEKLKQHPTGFLVLGDGICSFNPIYGQGMSSAAQQAVALSRCLNTHGVDSSGMAPAFYKAAAKVIANPWAIAAGGDFSFAETTGVKPPMVDLMNRYVRRAVIAAQRDPVVASALWDVQNLLAPPPSLMKPKLMLRVRRYGRRPVEPQTGSTRATAAA